MKKVVIPTNGDRVLVYGKLHGKILLRGDRVSEVKFDRGYTEYVPNRLIQPVTQRKRVERKST